MTLEGGLEVCEREGVGLFTLQVSLAQVYQRNVGDRAPEKLHEVRPYLSASEEGCLVLLQRGQAFAGVVGPW